MVLTWALIDITLIQYCRLITHNFLDFHTCSYHIIITLNICVFFFFFFLFIFFFWHTLPWRQSTARQEYNKQQAAPPARTSRRRHNRLKWTGCLYRTTLSTRYRVSFCFVFSFFSVWCLCIGRLYSAKTCYSVLSLSLLNRLVITNILTMLLIK